jgi:small subunit ribosomal protein S20
MRAAVGRTIRNKSVRSAVKTRVVRVRRAIAEHAEGIAELGVAAIASLDKAANKGILHANNAGRRKSRLMKALNNAEAAPAAAATATKAKAKPPAAKSAKATKAAKPAASRVKAPARPAVKGAAKPATKAAKPAAKKR